jgi:hypothetical protein
LWRRKTEELTPLKVRADRKFVLLSRGIKGLGFFGGAEGEQQPTSRRKTGLAAL